jgi:hypothetical protein
MHEIMDKGFIWVQNLVLYLLRSGLQFLSCYSIHSQDTYTQLIHTQDMYTKIHIPRIHILNIYIPILFIYMYFLHTQGIYAKKTPYLGYIYPIHIY